MKKLDPKKTYIVLFTRGRITKQKSLKYFTPTMISDTVVVTCRSEVDQLKEQLAADGIKPLQVLSFPDEYRLITKRYKMAQWLQKQGCRQFLFCDDDVNLSVLIGDRYKSTRSEEGQKALDKFWKRMPALWADYEGIGISANSRNNRNYFNEKYQHKSGLYIQENTKSGCFFGYKTDAFVKRFAFLSDNKLLQDVAYMDLMSNVLTLNEHKIARVYDLSWATTFDDKKTSGGMNAYRTKGTNHLALLLLMLLIPGTFFRRPERNVFEIMKIHRHGWKPVTEWAHTKIDWDTWYAQVNKEWKLLRGEKQLRDWFSDNEGFQYVRELTLKMQSIAQSDCLVLKLALEGKTVVAQQWLNGKLSAIPKPISDACTKAHRGIPIRVEVVGKRNAEINKIETHVNALVLQNWRK